MNLILIIQHTYSFEPFWIIIEGDFDFFDEGYFCPHPSIIFLKINFKNLESLKIVIVVNIFFLVSICIEKLHRLIDKFSKMYFSLN